jgi:hypothetical protein
MVHYFHSLPISTLIKSVFHSSLTAGFHQGASFTKTYRKFLSKMAAQTVTGFYLSRQVLLFRQAPSELALITENAFCAKIVQKY